jgi:hypothetical protein
MDSNKLKGLIPFYLATIGLLIAIATIFSDLDDKSSGLGLAGTAIAGAAGLAKPDN